NRQKRVLIEKFAEWFEGDLKGKRIAVWGLAFKPRTDDVREAPALVLIDWLLERGASGAVHDPEAMNNVRAQYGDRLQYYDLPLDALENADALAICTEWSEFRNPDFEQMRSLMAKPLIFDGRNLYDPQVMRDLGFTYYSIGRSTVRS